MFDLCVPVCDLCFDAISKSVNRKTARIPRSDCDRVGEPCELHSSKASYTTSRSGSRTMPIFDRHPFGELGIEKPQTDFNQKRDPCSQQCVDRRPHSHTIWRIHLAFATRSIASKL